MDEAVARDVARAFCLGALAGPPDYVARGAMGEIWRVVTATGEWAVKALFSSSSSPAVPEDVAVQRVAHAEGVPLPAPVVAAGAAVHLVNGTAYRVYEWVDLDPPLPVPPSLRRAEEAGALLAMVHSLPFTVEGRAVEDWYTGVPPVEVYHRLADAASAEGRSWAQALGEAESVIHQLTTFIRSGPSTVGLCHRDFEPTNVLPRAGDGPLVVLDWENAGPLPRDDELAAALLGWATAGGVVDTGAADAFLDGYRRSGGTARLDPEHSFSTSAATALNFLRVMGEQALTDARHRPFAEERLDRLLPQGLSDLVASIRGLIDSGLC